MDVDRFLDECEADGNLRGRLVHVERIPPRAARYGRLKEPLPDEILQSLAGTGVRELFTHQVDAIEALRRGENIVVVTGTASGKTLCYNIPVLETIAHDPSVRALYLFPTKALAQDQLRALAKLGVPALGPRERQRGGRRMEHLPNSSQQVLPGMADAFWPPAGTYDGDTPKVLRSRMRSEAGIVLSNPDMVHAGMLPSHGSWSTFLAGLRYVVIDELHACRGVFGSHTANVIRRLRRICRNYGSSPQFICCSATIANPVEHAEAMVGLPMTLIDDDGSPRGKRAFALWNPPLIDAAQGIRKSANTEAAELMSRLIGPHMAQTIAFTRSRSTAEVLCKYVRQRLTAAGYPRIAVTPYRAGYLPTERRAIEAGLASGQIRGVASTNALELGIDVGGLDACLIVGYPGTVASTWQQSGRAGRSDRDSLTVLVARDGPIDQYIMSHPDFIFGKPHEHAFIKHDNPYVLMDHIRCAAAELPLTGDDAALFGEDLGAIAEILADEGELAERDGRWYWRKSVNPAHEVRLRGVISDSSYTVQDLDTNKVIASADEWAAYNLLHPGAVYMLDGETYLVEELDITTRIAYVRKRRVGYFTLPCVRDPGFPVDGDSQERTWRGCALWLGDIGVAPRVVGFEKRSFWRHERIGGGALDLPELRMETVGLDIQLPETTTERAAKAGLDCDSGWVGASNALLGVLPGFVMCDDSDVAASWPDKVPRFYDRYPGGLGYVEKLYHIIEDVWQAAYELVRDCPCQNGCPACVGVLPSRWELPAEYTDMGRPFAPGMEIHMTGKIADKQSALFILRDVLAPLFPP